MNEESELGKNLRRIVKASFILFFGIFISKLLAYAFRIVIARSYSPEVYGLYSLGFAIIVWISTMGALGLPEGLLRFISIYRGKKETDKIRQVLRYSIYLMLITGVFLGIISFFLSEAIAVKIFNNPSLALYLKIFSLSIPIGLLSNVVLSSLRAFERVGWYSFIYNILQNTIRLLVLILLIFLGVNGESTAISFLISICAMLIVGFMVLRRYFEKYLEKAESTKKSIKREVFLYSLPLMLTGIVGVFLYSIDTIFIGYFIGTKEVGFYNAAVPIAALLTISSEMFNELFFPLINKAYARKNKNLIKSLSIQVSKWILLVNIPVLMLLFIFPGAIINLLFGQDYLVAERTLQILCIGMLFSSLSVVPRNLIAMTGKSKAILMSMLVMGVINAILNTALIPRFGIEGAAIATSISYTFMGIMIFTLGRKYSGIIPIPGRILLIIVSSVIAAFVIFFVRIFVEINTFSLVILFLSFCLLCLILFFLTGCFDKQDKEIYSSIIKRLKKSIKN